MSASLVRPHGGVLVDLRVEPDRASQLRTDAAAWPSWALTARQLCDLQLLTCGGFSPLRGFLGRDDYSSVCDSMRVADGTLWPIPVTLDVPEQVVRAIDPPGMLSLTDAEGTTLAALHVTDAWQPNLLAEAAAVFGTTDATHPGVDHLLNRTHPWYLTGALEVVRSVEYYDFPDLRHTPGELRADFALRGWERVVAFNTRNPMHRAHFELTLRGARMVDANLLIHPVVGVTKPGDVDHYTRVRCYRALLPSYPPGLAMLSLLPLAMRMAGPREALWHALIRKNYGASHFIVGRDHAGPGLDRAGVPFYRPYAAQELLERHEAELGVQIVRFGRMVYLVDGDRYVEEQEVPRGAAVLHISGTDQRRRLVDGEELPAWFTPPEVAQVLRRRFRPRRERGFTVFFTGLPGAGKSTIARSLQAKLLASDDRTVTLLDGDRVRHQLWPELGFSHDDRDLNVRRIGFVAAEVTKAGGIALCAAIAPYEQTREAVRNLVEPGGGFVLVHVATPPDVCEQRDDKGLYARARAGLLPSFTGVTDPYEAPSTPDLVVDAATQTPDQAAESILAHLRALGYLAQGDQRSLPPTKLR